MDSPADEISIRFMPVTEWVRGPGGHWYSYEAKLGDAPAGEGDTQD